MYVLCITNYVIIFRPGPASRPVPDPFSYQSLHVYVCMHACMHVLYTCVYDMYACMHACLYVCIIYMCV